VFRARCEVLGRDVLIWPSDLLGVHNTVDGISIHYTCACGEEAEIITGAIVSTLEIRHPIRAA
jgi:hypothetical protein